MKKVILQKKRIFSFLEKCKKEKEVFSIFEKEQKGKVRLL
jgi:hypothetical protein